MGLDLRSLIGKLDETTRRTFGRVVRFELRFWDAVHQGERW